ncbi:hypothetical protein OSTOST_07899 [Ostertagia ostertagi]
MAHFASDKRAVNCEVREYYYVPFPDSRMVKQRKSKGSDTLQSPGEVAAPDLTISPMKKAKTNGLMEEVDIEGENLKENGDTPKGKKAKPLTMGQLAEQQRVESEEKPPQTSGGASLSVQLTQGLMSNDVIKLDSVLREVRVEIIQATLLDLQVSHVVPLLKALFERLSSRSATNIKPWILWIQCILSLHASYLSSIGRRMNRTVVVAPQPLIVFNDGPYLYGETSWFPKSVVLLRVIVTYREGLDVHSDIDDLESGGSEESGVSSDEEEEDWWDEGGLGAGDEDENEDDDDSDDDSDVNMPTKRMNGDSDGSGTDDNDEPEAGENGDDEGDDDEEDEMDIG